MASEIHSLAWAKYIFGDPQPLARSIGISNVSKFAVGRYRMTVISSDVGHDLTVDGLVWVSVSGPYIAAGDFFNATNIEIQIRNPATGALVDPVDGTHVVVEIRN